MSKWNHVISPSKPDTVNRAGGEAFTETPEVALVNLVLTSFMKDKSYEAAKDEQARLSGLLAQVDPQFAAKAAIYARKKFGMRSITHFTSAWIAKNVHGSTWARKFFENVVHRVGTSDSIGMIQLSRLPKVSPTRAVERISIQSLSVHKRRMTESSF